MKRDDGGEYIRKICVGSDEAVMHRMEEGVVPPDYVYEDEVEYELYIFHLFFVGPADFEMRHDKWSPFLENTSKKTGGYRPFFAF